MPTSQPYYRVAFALALSFALVVMVAIAIAGPGGPLFISIVACATLPTVALRWMFPNSGLLWIAFVNLIAVYASVFALFADEVFKGIPTSMLAIGFALPVASFIFGCWHHQGRVPALVMNPALRDQSVSHALLWLVPVGLVGALVMLVALVSGTVANSEPFFLIAMLLIGLIVFAVSGEVANFLVNVGLLFEEFFQRFTHLIVPALAFLTFYLLIIVVFAAAYAIASKAGPQEHFRIGANARSLSYPEALHFSVVTLSTVGYGDIVPVTGLARSLAAIEVVIGTMLLLFGVSEILEYARERRKKHHRPDE
jgi:voltage-gated potassium channel